MIMVLKKIRGYRYILVVIDKFSNVGLTVSLKSENAQIRKSILKTFL